MFQAFHNFRLKGILKLFFYELKYFKHLFFNVLTLLELQYFLSELLTVQILGIIRKDIIKLYN